MNERIVVKTQAEFDAVVQIGNIAVCMSGRFEARGNSSVEARGNSSVVAWENSSVVAWENSSVVAWENSSVVAWGNSSVEARGNSSVVAWGNVFIRLFSCIKIHAGIHVLIMDHGNNKKLITGGKVISAFKPKTPAQWCSHWGVKVENKIAIVFKALNDKFKSPKGGDYIPGTIPIASDWDGGNAECGGGLHFSPTPKMAKYGFNNDATKFCACPVALKDIAVHPDGQYPEKIKAKGCCAPVWEVDEDGNKIEAP